MNVSWGYDQNPSSRVASTSEVLELMDLEIGFIASVGANTSRVSYFNNPFNFRKFGKCAWILVIGMGFKTYMPVVNSVSKHFHVMILSSTMPLRSFQAQSFWLFPSC